MPKCIEMECKVADKTVQWVGNDDGHRIGRLISVDGWPITCMSMNLVREYHTGKLFIVDPNMISPYPSEPIPEPTK